jgi:cell division septation protein DedD
MIPQTFLNRLISVRPALWLLPLLAVSACAPQYQTAYSDDGAVPYDGTDPAAEAQAIAPSRYYPPPGAASDPWGPYIQEAAARYHVPLQWIRAVMHQESGGREQAVSPVGAMGLMQVMPATYAGLRQRHSLGDDPFDPHNNILAGAAYIREMYDRFGAPGFLAAYNAGPDRLTSYLTGGTSLPDETVNYLASITPNLGTEVPLTGPLAMYAGGSPASPAPTVATLAAGCDVNAAYDPDHPCAPLTEAAAAPVEIASAPLATPSALAPSTAQPESGWAIQVGAFANPGLARAVAEGARAEAPQPLRAAVLSLPPTTPFGGSVLYRARLANLSANAASAACAQLNQRQLPCIVVSPNGS